MSVPSIIDIAKRAGVSKSTAARALSGNGSVKEATRRKVQAAADPSLVMALPPRAS